MNWGFKTAPQADCNNREIDYSRGLCMGGSSSINFGVYTIGARDDYQEWARIVGDDAFAWTGVQQKFKDLETFHGEIPEGIDRKYVAPKTENHGGEGPLHVGFAREWERDLTDLLDVFEQAGFPLNPDHNSGNPIGMSVLISSAHKGLRSTAGDLVKERLDNLTIVTGAPVQRVLLEGKKAVGVESNGNKCENLPSLRVTQILIIMNRFRHKGSHSIRRLAERPSYPDALRHRPRRPTPAIQNPRRPRCTRYWSGASRPLLRPDGKHSYRNQHRPKGLLWR